MEMEGWPLIPSQRINEIIQDDGEIETDHRTCMHSESECGISSLHREHVFDARVFAAHLNRYSLPYSLIC